MAEKTTNAQTDSQKNLSRREFSRKAAIVAATAAWAPDTIFPRPVPTSPTRSAQEKKPSPESQAEVEEKVAAIFRKYGERFTEAQKADIRRLVTEGQKPLEAMRAFPLDNSNQPGNVMKIFPDAGAAARRARSR